MTYDCLPILHRDGKVGRVPDPLIHRLGEFTSQGVKLVLLNSEATYIHFIAIHVIISPDKVKFLLQMLKVYDSWWSGLSSANNNYLLLLPTTIDVFYIVLINHNQVIKVTNDLALLLNTLSPFTLSL